jgi:hypothetical protein
LGANIKLSTSFFAQTTRLNIAADRHEILSSLWFNAGSNDHRIVWCLT